MGKKLTLLAALLACLGLCACAGRVRGADIDLGRSSLYTQEEREAAAEVVTTAFAELRGCVLHSLTYAGDQVSRDDLAYMRDLAGEPSVSDCIVFDSSFRSPLRGGGAWEANEEYTWRWYLAREPGGDWLLLTYGYG